MLFLFLIKALYSGKNITFRASDVQIIEGAGLRPTPGTEKGGEKEKKGEGELEDYVWKWPIDS